jgi:hypothetical protein
VPVYSGPKYECLGRKERQTCSMIGTQQTRGMESSSASAPLAKEPGTNGAAGSVAAQETKVSGPQEASKAREAQETNMSGLQETPEKEPVAARSGAEPQIDET